MFTTPDASKAVGSVHDTSRPGVPSSTTELMFAGQFWIIGGVVSSDGRRNDRDENGKS